MKLGERLGRGEFLRIVEVFPPNFSADRTREPMIGLRQKTRDFVERVKRIQSLADAIMIADVKDLTRLKLATIYSAAVLQEEVGIEAIPVINARDYNGPAIRSMILTALAYGLTSLMLVWGDRYSAADAAKNVYDYEALSEMVGDARLLSSRAGLRPTIFAPVDIAKLGTDGGKRIAESRLENGADYLMAQPPTVDIDSTLVSHTRILKRTRLHAKVLLNVFPFRNSEDIVSCRQRFGWNLPHHLDGIARQGEQALLREARKVAEKLEEKGSPGVYVSTRGRPELARFILD